jgi:stage IV sporulation protein B
MVRYLISVPDFKERRQNMQRYARRIATTLLLSVVPVYAAVGYYAWQLPDHYYVQNGTEFALPTALHITTARETSSVEQCMLQLFGVVPIKTVSVQSVAAPMLVPCGQPFGIKLEMDGVMVVGFGAVTTADGEACPAENAGLQKGDMIHAINDIPVTDGESVRNLITTASDTPLTFEITRESTSKTITVEPVYSITDQQYETGLWVRDSTAGVGTITFYEPESGTFGGLGHPICDTDTGTCIPIGEGEACAVSIQSVLKGSAGNPGMLQGQFLEAETPLGVLQANNRCGVFGTLLENPAPDTEAIPMAFKQEVVTGEATILCTISGTEPTAYTIAITDVDYSGSDSTQNMVITVTDPALLEATGGIVQGMSGSPIIQNGKLVGAVTHVFVDDPTKGYGIFCENMICSGQADT